MADIPASNWNETDASNSTAAPDGAPEGMAPSGVNDTIRAVMGAVKRFFNWQSAKTTAGTATAYTLTYTVAPAALVDGMTHLVQFNQTNGAAATLNVNALGAIPIHYWTGAAWAAPPAGGIVTNMVTKVAYNTAAGTYRIASSSSPIIAQSIGANGYTTHQGGGTPIREQWGTVTVTGLGASQAVTFPIAFSAAPYTIQITELSNNTAPGYVIGAGTTGFTLVNPGSNGSSYYWFALGPA